MVEWQKLTWWWWWRWWGRRRGRRRWWWWRRWWHRLRLGFLRRPKKQKMEKDWGCAVSRTCQPARLSLYFSIFFQKKVKNNFLPTLAIFFISFLRLDRFWLAATSVSRLRHNRLIGLLLDSNRETSSESKLWNFFPVSNRRNDLGG